MNAHFFEIKSCIRHYDWAPKMDIQIIWYIVFLSILFIIYFISRLLIKKPTTPTYDPDWWDFLIEDTEELLKPTFCKYCGEKYEKGEKYCHLCGTGLKELTE